MQQRPASRVLAAGSVESVYTQKALQAGIEKHQLPQAVTGSGDLRLPRQPWSPEVVPTSFLAGLSEILLQCTAETVGGGPRPLNGSPRHGALSPQFAAQCRLYSGETHHFCSAKAVTALSHSIAIEPTGLSPLRARTLGARTLGGRYDRGGSTCSRVRMRRSSSRAPPRSSLQVSWPSGHMQLVWVTGIE